MKTVIDQMLVKAGAYFGGEGVIYADFDPKKFAELVRADEREACAKVCEQEWNEYCTEPCGYALAVKECADAIRARGQK